MVADRPWGAWREERSEDRWQIFNAAQNALEDLVELPNKPLIETNIGHGEEWRAAVISGAGLDGFAVESCLCEGACPPVYSCIRIMDKRKKR